MNRPKHTLSASVSLCLCVSLCVSVYRCVSVCVCVSWCVRVSVCPCVSVSLCLCLSVCLCQTNLHMRVARKAPPTKTSTVQALLCLQQRKLSSRLFCNSGPRLASVCLLPQTAAFSPTGSSNRVRAALPIRRRSRHQVSDQLGAFAAQSFVRLKDKRLNSRTVSLRFLHLSRNRSDPRFRRTFVVSFCMRASHDDVYPELLQDSWEAGDNLHNRAPEHRFGIGLPLQPNRTAQSCTIGDITPLRRAACSLHRTARSGLALAPGLAAK